MGAGPPREPVIIEAEPSSTVPEVIDEPDIDDEDDNGDDAEGSRVIPCAVVSQSYTLRFTMYVRWQSRERRRQAFPNPKRRKGPDIHWAAILLESKRIKGKPTQRHIAYIGGITDSAIAIIHQRCWFWDAVQKRLNRLGKEVSPEDRKKIEATIAEKVPRPTKAQYRRCVRDHDAWFA